MAPSAAGAGEVANRRAAPRLASAFQREGNSRGRHRAEVRHRPEQGAGARGGPAIAAGLQWRAAAAGGGARVHHEDCRQEPRPAHLAGGGHVRPQDVVRFQPHAEVRRPCPRQVRLRRGTVALNAGHAAVSPHLKRAAARVGGGGRLRAGRGRAPQRLGGVRVAGAPAAGCGCMVLERRARGHSASGTAGQGRGRCPLESLRCSAAEERYPFVQGRLRLHGQRYARLGRCHAGGLGGAPLPRDPDGKFLSELLEVRVPAP
mmetsp:Transcript_118002/g.328862  ORF Transcript_118002/g.328862 Transcript_118002/m.328862 type:complete len:260 (-) Transcript_118002:598-1377(-)